MNKLIGIPGWSTGESSFGVSKPYLEHIRMFGEPVILTPNTFIENLDLVYLPGGKDVINGGHGDFSFFNSDGERFLEHFDRNTLPKYIAANVPIWGTCRGFQTIARHFGMKITQNIDWDHGYSKDEYDTTVHKITLDKKYAAYSKLVNKIGSWHHQCLLLQDTNLEEFEVIGVVEDRPDLEVVEYFKHKTLNIAGCQSHPERNYDGLSTLLINKLLKIA